MAVTYLSGERIQGILGAAAVPLSGSITSFVFDFDWYRGSSDTSDESNKNSNKIFVSTHNAGYSNSGQPSTSRQMGFMFSSGNNIGIDALYDQNVAGDEYGIIIKDNIITSTSSPNWKINGSSMSAGSILMEGNTFTKIALTLNIPIISKFDFETTLSYICRSNLFYQI